MWVEKTAAVILKKEQYVPLKHQYPTTRLHGVTTKHKILPSLWKLCSRVSMFVISHFNIIVRILVTSSGKMECRPHDWKITLHSCYCSDHSKLSQALLFIKCNWLVLFYGMRLSFNHAMYFMFPKSVCILLKINFDAFKVFVFLLWYFMSYLNQRCNLHCKLILTFMTSRLLHCIWWQKWYKCSGLPCFLQMPAAAYYSLLSPYCISPPLRNVCKGLQV